MFDSGAGAWYGGAVARPLRIEFPGALYHVMSRGNERRRIVKDDKDRARRIDWLRRTVETYGWYLHAWVLMDNHDHLYVETPEANLAGGMQHLNGSYTSYYNRRHRRNGHLFQGRYKAHLIESEGHYCEVSRYIHLNPVRAGLVDRPEDWPWGSYRGYHRATRRQPWVTYDRVLEEFGRNAEQARRAYRRFVAEGMATMPPSPWKDAVEGLIVGGEGFVEKMRRMLGKRPADRSVPALEALRPRSPLERIASALAESFGIDPARWSTGRRNDDASRAVAAFLARRRYGYRAKEVAEALGYTSHGGVAAAVRRIESAGAGLRRKVEQLETTLTSD